MTEITIIEVLNPDDMEACYAIRTEVFCGEQQVDAACRVAVEGVTAHAMLEAVIVRR